MGTANKKLESVMQINGEKPNEIIQAFTQKVKDTGPKFGCRHVQMLLLSLGQIFCIGTRTNLSVAIVAMTDNTASPNPDIPTYNWDNTSVILSSFFWSYVILQIPAGYLGKTYGPKYFLLVSYFVNCCACILTPLAAEQWGSTGVMICRIIQGFGQSFLYPSLNVLLGRWAPEQERTTLYNFAMAGSPLASIFSSLLAGYISASWWGWPASFYILGGLGIGWCFVWLNFGQNSPASHPRISDQERNYIQASLKQQDNSNLPIPWKKIFTSVPFYALMVASISNCWGYTIMMTETPIYLSKVMNFDVASNGLITSTPPAVTFIFCLILGPLSDWIISKKLLTSRNSRRIFHLTGTYGQAICIIWLSFLNRSKAYWSPFALILGNAFSSLISIGSDVNHLDLSPRFSGVIFGIVNGFGLTISLLGPLSVHWIVTNPTSESQWQIVFLTAAGFMIVGGSVFFFFMSAKRQPWDGPKDEKQIEEEESICN